MENRSPIFRARVAGVIVISRMAGVAGMGESPRDPEYCIPEIERRIREALLQDDRITAVENFQFEWGCRNGRKPPFPCPQNQVFPACCVRKGFLKDVVKGNIEVLQLHGGGGLTQKQKGTFPAVG